MEKPNCYKCKFRRELDWSAHSCCSNRDANVEGHEQGKRRGWFSWPVNFDPVWLTECDGFKHKEAE